MHHISTEKSNKDNKDNKIFTFLINTVNFNNN